MLQFIQILDNKISIMLIKNDKQYFRLQMTIVEIRLRCYSCNYFLLINSRNVGKSGTMDFSTGTKFAKSMYIKI